MKTHALRQGHDATRQSVLAGLAAWEGDIHAFVAIAEEFDSQAGGPLSGISVGVKDIIDVAGLPTRNGSAACLDAGCAGRDAPVVAALRAAGALIAGKTKTTEFAFTDPTNCRNPYDLSRSPGGSSSGSGAAVGAGIVDIALGTQTAGSLCRPAAYCGAVGFKPSYGALSTEGVTPLAPSFDTVGIIARSTTLASTAFTVMTGQSPALPAIENFRVRRALPRGLAPTDSALAALDAAERAIAGHATLTAPLPDIEVEAVVDHHRLVMNHEAYVAHPGLIAPDRIDLLRPNFRAGLLKGSQTSPAQAETSRAALAEAKEAFWAKLDSSEFLLTLPVPDGAPHVDGTTGFQNWLTPWTVFGGPLLCLPWGLDGLGRPRSVMLAARPGLDLALLAFGASVEGLAPDLPRPVPHS